MGWRSKGERMDWVVWRDEGSGERGVRGGDER